MTAARPPIRADVAAALTAQLPARLAKKLDADPDVAARWTWTATSVTTDKGEVVTLALAGDVVTAVACSCLLSPKCLHVAAVVAQLPPEAAVEAAVEVAVDAPAEVAAPSKVVDTAVATACFRVLADVLATGAETTGAFAQAELLRSIHACRAHGLHRLATALARVLRSIRELRADKPEFDLDVLAADLREALDVAYALSAGGSSEALVGTARRDYEPAGGLRLRGLFTEAVVARSGYAGAVTYLVDEPGRMFTRADVAPGDAARAIAAYDASAGLGDVVLAHRELGRAGLFVSEATASADGRLGAGQRVRAVRASEPARWEHLAPRFAVPLADQLAAIAAAADAQPAGWDLVFVEGVILGGGGFAVGPLTLRLTTPLDHRALPARDNLAALARAPGLALRVIARVRLGAPRHLEPLAIAPAHGELRLTFPAAWQGRANLTLDRISPPRLGDARAPAVPLAPDLLAALRRRVERVVQGGAGTLPTHALAELDREAAALADLALGGGATALRDLAAVAQTSTRTLAGARRGVDRLAFARAWLRASLYEVAARRRLSLAAW